MTKKKKANLYNPANVTIKDLLDLMVTLAGGPVDEELTLKEQDAMTAVAGMLIRSGYQVTRYSILSYFDSDDFDGIEQHAQVWIERLFGSVLWVDDEKS
jgi:hypothetical protein